MHENKSSQKCGRRRIPPGAVGDFIASAPIIERVIHQRDGKVEMQFEIW
jgi:hypothetical protein